MSGCGSGSVVEPYQRMEQWFEVKAVQGEQGVQGVQGVKAAFNIECHGIKVDVNVLHVLADVSLSCHFFNSSDKPLEVSYDIFSSLLFSYPLFSYPLFSLLFSSLLFSSLLFSSLLFSSLLFSSLLFSSFLFSSFLFFSLTKFALSFKINNDCTVYAFEAEVSGKKIVGVCKEKAQAFNQYLFFLIALNK